jgi:hypothetical protein
MGSAGVNPTVFTGDEIRLFLRIFLPNFEPNAPFVV